MEAFGTFAWCLLSAFFPLANAEAYLLLTAARTDTPLVVVALAAATGQVLGKMVFYLVGYGVVQTPWLQRRAAKRGRFVVWMERLSAWCTDHPWGAVGVVAVSGSVGFPPIAAVSVLAGSLRMPWWVFGLTAWVGRFARFLLVLHVPGLFGY